MTLTVNIVIYEDEYGCMDGLWSFEAVEHGVQRGTKSDSSKVR
jgi:hypothetical protein